jgi:hypothetical protein
MLVEYKKALDTVWRAGLWNKFLDANIKGKVIRVIINLVFAIWLNRNPVNPV